MRAGKHVARPQKKAGDEKNPVDREKRAAKVTIPRK
jgi:hypothetical protein